MSFNGKTLRVEVKDKIAHVIFDNTVGSSNVLGKPVIDEIPEVLKVLKSGDFEGAILKSAKSHFIFGADITEFLGHFGREDNFLYDWLQSMIAYTNEFEDLPFPTVTAINGFALGGGLEMALTTDYRIMASDAKIGLPEVKLGIIPGWGGTVRLPRMVGADNAIEWITSGKQYKAEDAFKIRVVDGVVAPDKLEVEALKTLKRAIDGELDWKAKRAEKKAPLRLSPIEATMSFETSKAFVAGMAGRNYPAPVKAVEVMEEGRGLSREEASKLESKAFVELSKTPTADSLVGMFLADQYLKKVSKKTVGKNTPPEYAAVLGAGIMGGGIAYQSASKGTPILMKDIAVPALSLGMNEAKKLLGKQLQRKKINADQMADTLNMIHPTLSYGDINQTQLVVEAVVENVNVKKSVLAEVEELVNENTILTSNTSTISITELAKDLKRPENFCGMHFFNPVHRMPLVEVIRGEKTSDEAIAKTVAYALKLGKTPIVVNDCAGFLVNRVLFPYFNGFNKLIEDGVDYQRIDKVMERFGWPMGPAYLMDVVGVDTGHHAAAIMADAFPDRMKMENKTIVTALNEANRFGQKNGVGFYKYEIDKKGRPKKSVDASVNAIISSVVKTTKEVTDEEIIDRMMFPMLFECVRCLDEKIVNTPVEVDMGLIMGLGFPPFHGGMMKWASREGIATLTERAKQYEGLGEMYRAPESFVALGKTDNHYYSNLK